MSRRSRIAESPAAFAEYAGEGLWRPAPHLTLTNEYLLKLARREIRKLMIFEPPRHGKSMLCSEFFPAWWLGQFPEDRILLTSYEADFASQWGRKARDLLEEHGMPIFGIEVSNRSSAANRWDLAGHRGGMQTAGARGAITGKGGDLFIIDDPVKNEKDAHSPTIQEDNWDWFRATARTRLQPNGVILLIMTRWDENDLAGRILQETPEGWTILMLPALAEDPDPENGVDPDPLGRQPGEPLWPEMYDLDALHDLRTDLGSYYWSALYQQRPVPVEGGLIKREWLSQFVDAVPVGCKRVRYWDKAGTEGGGDFSAGVLIAQTKDKRYVIEDVVRGQWSPMNREQIIYQTAVLDEERHKATGGSGALEIWAEQEGGSGGKESAMSTKRNLAGFTIRTETVTGSKEVRAHPFAAQCEAGNVLLVKGDWNRSYIDELVTFPYGAHDDQVDGSSGSFNKLVKMRAIGRPAQVIRR